MRGRALAIGRTRVAVTTASGVRAYVELSVADVASATIEPDDLTIWNLDTHLSVVHEGATSGLAPAGYALLPDGQLRLGVTLEDDEDRELIGHDVPNWRADPDFVVFEYPDALVDDIVVYHGGAIGDVDITTVGDGHFDLTLLSEPVAASLEVYLPETGVVGGPLTLPVGEARTVVLLAYDDTGRLLLGNGSSGLRAIIVEDEDDSVPLTAEVIDPPWAGPRGDIELDAVGWSLLESLRVVYVQGREVGRAALRLESIGAAYDLPITITAN